MEEPPTSVTRGNAQADQRRRILRATGELVAEHGYANVTIEMIVKRARVSFKTLYKHYPGGKQDCFVALFESAFETTERAIRERLAAEQPLPWAEQVVLALRTFVETIVAEPVIARAVIVESPAVGPPVTERYEAATKALVPLFRAGRDLNPRGPVLPDTVEDTLAGAVFWSAYERLIGGEVDELDAYLPVLLELILRTYLGQAEAARIARAEAPGPQPALA